VEGSTGTATFTCTNGVFDITGTTECTPSMCDSELDAIGSGVPRSDAIGSGVPCGDAIGSRVTELFKAIHLHCSLAAATPHHLAQDADLSTHASALVDGIGTYIGLTAATLRPSPTFQRRARSRGRPTSSATAPPILRATPAARYATLRRAGGSALAAHTESITVPCAVWGC
jgi:hypothetical protein